MYIIECDGEGDYGKRMWRSLEFSVELLWPLLFCVIVLVAIPRMAMVVKFKELTSAGWQTGKQ